MNARAIGAVVLVLAVAGGVAALSAKPDPKPHPPAPDAPTTPAASNGATTNTTSEPPGAGMRDPFTKSEDCKTCHAAEFAEWQGSMHGKAWTDPMVQGLSNGFRMSECIDCHAPMPIQQTGISARVAPRQHSRGDGVDCLTCHLMDDGVSVAATRTVDTSKTPNACKPVLVPEMGKPAACAGCHNQHWTVDELAASGLKETCADCHMPAMDRGGRGGKSHVFPGAHSLDMHRKAVSMDLSIENRVLKVVVKNVGAGHQVPTDARHRSYNVFLSAWDDRGNQLVADKMIKEFRLYYRDDFRPSTQIKFGTTGEGTWPLPDGIAAGKIRVKLAYALNPEELGKKNVLVVWEKEIEFK